MSVADKVLELLENANHSFSGEEMAQQLGITRNSVWKAVGKLKEQGYEIEAATNRGYRLVSEKNVLTPQGVRRLLTGPARRCAIDVQDSVTSTNTLLKQIAEHGGAEGMVLIAHQQTQGKGRLGAGRGKLLQILQAQNLGRGLHPAHGRYDPVLQLPHVSGPVVCLHPLRQLPGDIPNVLVEGCVMLVDI